MDVTFDWNEWFFIISSCVALFLFFFIRKYFPLILIIIIWMYNMGLVATIDYFLIATPFKAYYFGDNPSYELSGALFHLFMYPCASLLFLFAYDKWKLYGKKTVWYIGVWSVFAIMFEWLCVKCHALTYTGWRLYYSIPAYPLAAILLIIVFRFAKRELQCLYGQDRADCSSSSGGEKEAGR